MNAPKCLIEVDEETAAALEAVAAERGLSVKDLVAELAGNVVSQRLSGDDIAELDRRWGRIEAGEPTISNDVVVQWLQTWGSPAFKPWHDR